MSGTQRKWALYQSISKVDYSAGFHDKPLGFFYAKDMRHAVRVFPNKIYTPEGFWVKIEEVVD